MLVNVVIVVFLCLDYSYRFQGVARIFVIFFKVSHIIFSLCTQVRPCTLATMPLFFSFCISLDKNYDIVNLYSLTGPEEFGVLQTCSQVQTSISWSTSTWNEEHKK